MEDTFLYHVNVTDWHGAHLEKEDLNFKARSDAEALGKTLIFLMDLESSVNVKTSLRVTYTREGGFRQADIRRMS